jgi:hypothetical protein
MTHSRNTPLGEEPIVRNVTCRAMNGQRILGKRSTLYSPKMKMLSGMSSPPISLHPALTSARTPVALTASKIVCVRAAGSSTTIEPNLKRNQKRISGYIQSSEMQVRSLTLCRWEDLQLSRTCQALAPVRIPHLAGRSSRQRLRNGIVGKNEIYAFFTSYTYRYVLSSPWVWARLRETNSTYEGS